MRYIEAPAVYDSPGFEEPVLFLGGGITGCPDWQRDAVHQLQALDCPAAVLNPRRAHFPAGDPAAHGEQVAWEYAALHRAAVILFWFCADTLQPVVLYELGAHAARDATLAVGAHPHYERRLDVVAQLRYARPEIEVHDRLEDTVRTAAAAAVAQRVRSLIAEAQRLRSLGDPESGFHRAQEAMEALPANGTFSHEDFAELQALARQVRENCADARQTEMRRTP